MTRLHVTRLPYLRVMLNFRQIRKSYRVFTNILATGRLPFVSCLLFGTFNKSFVEKRKRRRELVKIGMVLKKELRFVYFSNYVMLFDITEKPLKRMELLLRLLGHPHSVLQVIEALHFKKESALVNDLLNILALFYFVLQRSETVEMTLLPQ